MWNDHTTLAVFGTTIWGVNRAAYTFGYWNYQNPFYTQPIVIDGGTTINYSQPLVMETTVVQQPPDENAPPPGLAEFDAARDAFYQGDYATALSQVNRAISQMPNDPTLHEFRALVLFAQGDYSPAAAALYSVLAVGPGMDWTTMSSLYPSVEIYAQQLRTLEEFVDANPMAADARFVLAYHYLTLGEQDAAVDQLKEVVRQVPESRVARELLMMTAGPDAVPGAEPRQEVARAAAPSIDEASLLGNWQATGPDDTNFALSLSDAGEFTWTFSQGNETQTVAGVFALDGNTLALEPKTGGTMIAEITAPQDGQFQFQILGAPPGDPGLKFVKK
jgi:tetratricopeptide (TPR) repeat protein